MHDLNKIASGGERQQAVSNPLGQPPLEALCHTITLLNCQSSASLTRSRGRDLVRHFHMLSGARFQSHYCGCSLIVVVFSPELAALLWLENG